MSGRITKSDQQLRPDPRFNDRTLAKFINCVMYGGKKTTAQQILYDALDIIQGRLVKEKAEGAPTEAIDVFHKAISNVRPDVEVRSKRVGGANYQVPMQVSSRRRQSLCFRWIIQAARAEKDFVGADRIRDELDAEGIEIVDTPEGPRWRRR